MTLSLLTMVCLWGIVLHRRRTRLAPVFLWLALLLLFGIGCGPLPAWLLSRLQAPYVHVPTVNWAPRSAIVLLGAGALRTVSGEPLESTLFANGRILRAVELYRACKRASGACLLLVSGGDALHLGKSEAEIYATLLLKLGVEPADLRVETKSMNTWQNAQFSAPLLRVFDPQQTVLVTSAGHLPRAQLYFAHFGLHPLPLRGDYAKVSWSPVPLAWNFALTDLALHEIVGMWRYRLYQAMGWNARATQPGSP